MKIHFKFWDNFLFFSVGGVTCDWSYYSQFMISYPTGSYTIDLSQALK